MLVNIVVAITAGYLFGSVPFAYIVSRLHKGVDIRQLGGGNVGTLNVYREVGPVFGLAVLAADVAKGTLAIFLAGWLGLIPFWVCVAGFAAVIGHNWSCFLRFSGGKGAATIMGVLIPLLPVPFAIGFGIAMLVVVITSNVRLGFIGLVFIPLLAWIFNKPLLLVYFSLALLLFLIIRTLAGLRGDLARSGQKKNLIFDREYHFWQTRKNKDSS